MHELKHISNLDFPLQNNSQSIIKDNSQSIIKEKLPHNESSQSRSYKQTQTNSGYKNT